jgi:hypothetical protein
MITVSVQWMRLTKQHSRFVYNAREWKQASGIIVGAMLLFSGTSQLTIGFNSAPIKYFMM